MPHHRDRKILARASREWARFLKCRQRVTDVARKQLAAHLETIGAHLDAEDEAIRFLLYEESEG